MKTPIRFGFAAVALAVSQTLWAGSLQQIYQQALDSDPQLKSARAVFNAEREAEVQSRSSLLPSLSLSADVTYTDVSPSGIDQGNNHGYDLNLSQPLFRAEEWFNFQAGKVLTEKAGVTFSQSQQALIRRTVEAYLDVLAAQTDQSSALAVEAAVKRRLDQVQAQFEVGLIAITDVEEARASYDSARVSRILAEGQLDKSFEAIDRLTGQHWNKVDVLSNRYPVQGMTPTAYQPWVDKALSGNLALQSATLDVKSAEQSRKSTRSRHLPTVDLVAGYGTDRGARSLHPTNGTQESASIGLQFNLPLYSGGRTSSQVREASARWDAAIQTREDTQRAVVQNTRSLLRDLLTDVESVAARKQSIVSSETALEATSAGYSVGTRNIVDVLQAERTLYTSIRDYQAARYNYVRNLMSFKEALGTLSPEDITALDHWMVAPDTEAALYSKKAAADQS
ncbi:TolC family outer membrane protein [Motiliproteus sp.]|uniref:TolC family outer membrane protein n=1 Tax=Motiliproteus sp. TaxID=1898955 RepID=UPI003BAD2CD6